MARKKTKTEDDSIEITPVTTVTMKVFLKGKSPLLLNRQSEKVKRELLLPSPRKNQAAKALTLKHVPIDEYRDSVYRSRGDDAATRLVFPGGAFRKAIAAAALRVPGSSKAEVGQLVRIEEYNVSIFGVPQISAMMVRQADIKRTPDVRFRAIVPEWACCITVIFSSLIRELAVLTFLAASGDLVGVGDGRNEKGSLSFGCYEIVDRDDDGWRRIAVAGGREAQDEALENPVAFDLETEELLAWFDDECLRRHGQPASSRNGRKEEVAS